MPVFQRPDHAHKMSFNTVVGKPREICHCHKTVFDMKQPVSTLNIYRMFVFIFHLQIKKKPHFCVHRDHIYSLM